MGNTVQRFDNGSYSFRTKSNLYSWRNTICCLYGYAYPTQALRRKVF